MIVPIQFVENNPILNVNDENKTKIIKKIQDKFVGFECNVFLTNLYCCLNHNNNTEYIIDLDNLWKWLGYSNKASAVKTLEKHFIQKYDYIIECVSTSDKKHGGQNIIKYMLNADTFKLFCIKSTTTKAKLVHTYYTKLENILLEFIQEEAQELRLKLKIKDKENAKNLEDSIISQFPVNTECVYIGTIDDVNETNKKLVKFGHTNNLQVRTWYHHKDYTNFQLKAAFKVENKVQIENAIKKHPIISKRLTKIQINNKNKTEIITYDDRFTLKHIINIIKDVIKQNMYSEENFYKLLDKYSNLENENSALKEELHRQKDEIMNHILTINETKEKVIEQAKLIEHIKNEHESVFHGDILQNSELNMKFSNFIKEQCIVRDDVEELSASLEGRFRIWNAEKPTKEMFRVFKEYLDRRFKPRKGKGGNGYCGIKLCEVQYKKIKNNDDVENFIFDTCRFCDNGKILNSVMLKEYLNWKKNVGKLESGDEINDIKSYLNSYPHALKATVWTHHGTNEGYYGLCLKTDDYTRKMPPTSGKWVYKRSFVDNKLINKWQTIALAAEKNNTSPTKLRTFIKNKKVFDDDYYYSFE
jgi:hypothetical protein